jgi:2-polyprenyl-3-methyl-5-hydroxy-6-metoxy-1,4-benzoquinol methylase
MIRQQYNDISALYDLLSEGDDGIIFFRHYLEGLLEKLPEKAKVLDCSCGTGNHAIWLSKQGFDVYASDISDGMINTSRAKAEHEGLSIHFFQASWEELAEKTNEQFELVVCPGNSLSHATSFAMLEDALKAIRKITKPGGSFFFDMRNWEKTYAENLLEDQEFQVEGKDGMHDVRYRYNIRGWNEKGQMFVDVRPEGNEKYTHFEFDFLSIGYQQFHEALLDAGFEQVSREFFLREEYYFAIAK